MTAVMQLSGSDLVVLCARSFLSSGDEDHLQSALAQQPLDWAELEHAADRHSIVPIVAYALKKHGGDPVPHEVRERLNQRLHSVARRNLIWLAEWQQVLRAFESANIPVISLKGPAFAMHAYGNIALRESSDLDLLVQPSDVLRARDVLSRHGHQLRSPLSDYGDAALLRSRNRQLDFVSHERGTLIDLHWSALHAMFPFQLPIDMLFESARIESYEDFSYLSFSPEDLLLYLCAHGTKHCWLHLRWLCDVACYVQTMQKLDWDLCIRHAEAANCDLVLKHSLLLAGQVLGVKLPASVGSYCDNAKARMLANTAKSFLFGDSEDPVRGKSLRYYLAFPRGWLNRVRLAFERVLIPEEQDLQELHLPHSLRFLYYAVRPVRFMLEGSLR